MLTQSILHIVCVTQEMLRILPAYFLFPRLGVFPRYSVPPLFLPLGGQNVLPECERKGAHMAYLLSPILSLGWNLPVEMTYFGLSLQGTSSL